MSDLEIPGLARWMPLDLETDAEEYAAQLACEYPATRRVDLVASGVAGMAAQFRRAQQDAERAGDSVLVAAWLFLRSEEDLIPVAHATLQGLPLPATDATTESLVQLLVGEDDVYKEPEVSELETASGPATFVRYRPIQHVHGERRVHERTAVLWPRPQQEMVVVLSAYTDDLLAGQEVPDALAQLAEGVRGL